jgi:hypothetical protein
MCREGSATLMPLIIAGSFISKIVPNASNVILKAALLMSQRSSKPDRRTRGLS